MNKNTKKDLSILVKKLESLITELPTYDKVDEDTVGYLTGFVTVVTSFREKHKKELMKKDPKNLLPLLNFESENLFNHPFTGLIDKPSKEMVLVFEKEEIEPHQLIKEMIEWTTLNEEWEKSDRDNLAKEEQERLQQMLDQLHEDLRHMVNGIHTFMVNFTTQLSSILVETTKRKVKPSWRKRFVTLKQMMTKKKQ